VSFPWNDGTGTNLGDHVNYLERDHRGVPTVRIRGALADEGHAANYGSLLPSHLFDLHPARERIGFQACSVGRVAGEHSVSGVACWVQRGCWFRVQEWRLVESVPLCWEVESLRKTRNVLLKETSSLQLMTYPLRFLSYHALHQRLSKCPLCSCLWKPRRRQSRHPRPTLPREVPSGHCSWF
jgi:hypothetical protein